MGMNKTADPSPHWASEEDTHARIHTRNPPPPLPSKL